MKSINHKTTITIKKKPFNAEDAEDYAEIAEKKMLKI